MGLVELAACVSCTVTGAGNDWNNLMTDQSLLNYPEYSHDGPIISELSGIFGNTTNQSHCGADDRGAPIAEDDRGAPSGEGGLLFAEERRRRIQSGAAGSLGLAVPGGVRFAY
eukprot:7126804-Pyramimonas_sp.AAC.1